MKMRATMQGDVADVKVRMTHIMRPAYAKMPKQTNSFPHTSLTRLWPTLNGKTVLDAQWGVAIAKNPFIGFRSRVLNPAIKLPSVLLII